MVRASANDKQREPQQQASLMNVFECAGSDKRHAVQSQSHEMMVDSASGIHVCPLGFARKKGFGTEKCKTAVQTAGGHFLRHDGRQSVRMAVNGDQTDLFDVSFEVADVQRSIVSVSKMLSHGNSTHFAPSSSWIENSGGKRLKLEMKSGMFVLRTELSAG